MSDAYFNFHAFYRSIAADPRFNRIAEVGVYTGASVSFLAKEMLTREPAPLIYAIDLWENALTIGYTDLAMDVSIWEQFLERLNREGTHELVHPLKEHSTKAAEAFNNGFFDFVFIDADHSYEAVKADIAAWLPKLRPGGRIAGHDYGEPCGVKQAVDEAFTNVNVTGTVWYVDL